MKKNNEVTPYMFLGYTVMQNTCALLELISLRNADNQTSAHWLHVSESALGIGFYSSSNPSITIPFLASLLYT